MPLDSELLQAGNYAAINTGYFEYEKEAWIREVEL